MRIAIVFLKKVKKYYKFFENRFFRADRLSVRIKYCMHGSLRIIPASKKVLPCISEKVQKRFGKDTEKSGKRLDFRIKWWYNTELCV